MLSLRNPALALLAVFLLAGTTAESYAQTRWHQMDVGPFFSATFPPRGGSVAGYTHKGIAIRLSREPAARLF